MTRPTPPFVRNARVAAGQLDTPGSPSVYTVLQNNVLLLKHTSILYFGPAAATVTIYLTPSPSLLSVTLDSHEFTAAGFWTWQGWAALNANDQVVIAFTAGSLRYWLSGALLPFNPAFSAMAGLGPSTLPSK